MYSICTVHKSWGIIQHHIFFAGKLQDVSCAIHISQNCHFQFNSSLEGSLSQCLLDTAHNASNSKDVDNLKFRLNNYDTFYNGQIQQDSSECLFMLIEIINKGSVPHHVLNQRSVGVSLSEILFSFVLEKCIICEECGLKSPSFESSSVLHITPTVTPSMQQLIKMAMQQKLQKICYRCDKNTGHVESNHIVQPPKYLIVVVSRFKYNNNKFTKDKCPIPMDAIIMLGPHRFSLLATIDHHGPSINSGHYTTSVNCCKKTFYCNDSKINEFEMFYTKNSLTAYVIIYEFI